MARTPDQVGAVIDTALTDPTAFPNISQSAVAEWRLWRNIVATTISFFESILDLFTSQMNTALDTKQYGGISWWATKMLAYQSGYNLQVDSQGNVFYPTIDTSAQIIKQVSVREVMVNSDLILFIKVASTDENGNFIPLTADQQLQVQDYITSVKPAGVKTNLVSLPADTIYYSVTVLYDPLFNTYDVQNNILAALSTYRQNIGFDGIFYPSSFLDAIVQTQGVKGVQTNFLEGGANGQPLGGLGISYELASGYFNYSTNATGANNNVLTLNPAT
jgi:hypothetical protein